MVSANEKNALLHCLAANSSSHRSHFVPKSPVQFVRAENCDNRVEGSRVYRVLRPSLQHAARLYFAQRTPPSQCSSLTTSFSLSSCAHWLYMSSERSLACENTVPIRLCCFRTEAVTGAVAFSVAVSREDRHQSRPCLLSPFSLFCGQRPRG